MNANTFDRTNNCNTNSAWKWCNSFTCMSSIKSSSIKLRDSKIWRKKTEYNNKWNVGMVNSNNVWKIIRLIPLECERIKKKKCEHTNERIERFVECLCPYLEQGKNGKVSNVPHVLSCARLIETETTKCRCTLSADQFLSILWNKRAQFWYLNLFMRFVFWLVNFSIVFNQIWTILSFNKNVYNERLLQQTDACHTQWFLK